MLVVVAPVLADAADPLLRISVDRRAENRLEMMNCSFHDYSTRHVL